VELGLTHNRLHLVVPVNSRSPSNVLVTDLSSIVQKILQGIFISQNLLQDLFSDHELLVSIHFAAAPEQFMNCACFFCTQI
jgi:hypothetical protein